MSRTFDNIAEAASTNYLFLMAQMAIGFAQEPPTPPPLYVLSFPSELVCAALWVVKRFAPNASWLHTWATRKSWLERVSLDWEAMADKGKDADATDTAVNSIAYSDRKSSVLRDKVRHEARRRPSSSRRTLTRELNAEEKRKSIAKAISEYVLDHQADVAQEERWRTTMQRKMDQNNRSFRELIVREMKANQAVVNGYFQDLRRENMDLHRERKTNQEQMKANQDQMIANQDRNLRELRAEVSSAKEQMNTDNMDQIVSTLQSLAKGKASAV